MRKILLLISAFVLIFVCSCKNETITVTLTEIDELSNFMIYNQEYKISNKDTFTFPKLTATTHITEDINEDGIYTTYTKHLNTINFYGWETNNNKIIKENSVKLNEDTTYTPKYDISTSSYSITLITNGAKVTSTNSQDIYNFVLPEIIDDNFSFNGWYNNKTYIGTKIETIPYNSITAETVFYAKVVPTNDYVIELINNIPKKLTIFDIDILESAYNCYNLLSYNDKKMINNYSKLETAYNEIPNLKLAYDIYTQLTELYEQDLRADLKKELDMLLELINNTDESIKELIPEFDYDKFIDIVNKVNDLYELYIEEAIEFDKKISQIPIFQELYYEEAINELYNEYLDLDTNLKQLLNCEEKLETLYENLQNLNSLPLKYYFNTENTNNVYTSKKELFEGFFTDFYYYIAAYHGLDHLKNNKIKNVNDFVTLAGDFYGAGASNLYGIGNIAGRYMLEKDINGVLENQTENGFFGFCYKNNLYQDVLPFFINFFAYWRIDEKYANKHNYGADIFAESWAPTVDIAKFFYYNEETSYVQTDRMIDCLTNTASVVYNFNESNTLPTIKLRGYIFEGWYDNKNYEGNKITDISNTTSNKLFAKWTIDQNQVDKDAANLVDIYIYNLTTTKAVVNSITVNYVQQMYNNLSKKGKTLVKNYSTLEELIAKYN